MMSSAVGYSSSSYGFAHIHPPPEESRTADPNPVLTGGVQSFHHPHKNVDNQASKLPGFHEAFTSTHFFPISPPQSPTTTALNGLPSFVPAAAFDADPSGTRYAKLAGTPVRLGPRKLVEHDGFRGDVVSSDISAKQRSVILKRRITVEEEGSDGRSRQPNPAPTEDILLVEHNGFWGDVVLSDIHAKQRGVILKWRNTVEEDGGSRQHNPAPTEQGIYSKGFEHQPLPPTQANDSQCLLPSEVQREVTAPLSKVPEEPPKRNGNMASRLEAVRRRNQSKRPRPGRNRDASPTGYGQPHLVQRSEEIVNANSSTKRAYKRVKYFPEWYHWSGGHLITTTKSDGRKYLKKRLTRHDVKCLSDVVGFTIGLRDAPEEEIPPVHLPTLDGLIKVPGNGGRFRVVEVPQEPIACPTKQDVYVLELQHGFCRDYLKNNKNYQELHRKNFIKKEPLGKWWKVGRSCSSTPSQTNEDEEMIEADPRER